MLATMKWGNGVLHLLDQRVLPHTQQYIEYTSVADVAKAITDMVVRGAPAIGVTAAFAVALSARENANKVVDDDWLTVMSEDLTLLQNSRPTAVNLFWAINKAKELITLGGDDLPNKLEAWALDLYEQDIQINKTMGELGADLIPENATLYTHCNAGALATCGYGTALGVIRSAHSRGLVKQVYVGETRPWLQGARLTAFELAQENIPFALAVEGAAGYVMATEQVDWVIVGADRVAANGDVVNKIGTYNLAVLAKHHGAKLMVVTPTSTVDMSLSCGADIPIEQRNPTEITVWRDELIAPNGVAAVNPAFDMTPATLVDVLVTELGVVTQPNSEKLARLLG